MRWCTDSRTRKRRILEPHMKSAKYSSCLGVFLLAALMLCKNQPAIPAQEKKDEIVSAREIAKIYTEGKEAFDKAYKGKTVTVEGTVTNSGLKADGKSYLIVDGFTKPGDKFAH